MTDYLDSLDVCRLLTEACEAAGGQRNWCMRHAVSPSYVSNVLHARSEPGKAVLSALGLVRVAMYRKSTEAAQ